jgi:glycosyltransferase involved in cell wall biosynthesis
MESRIMTPVEQTRIAWLLPTMGRGGISWQHLLCEFTKHFPETLTFTGEWAGYVPGFEHTFQVQEVGQTRFIETNRGSTGYGFGFSYVSPAIASHLLRYRPNVIFANAFSIWTAIALLLKPVGRWQVIITYEGSSPNVDYQDARLRLWSRQLMVRLADAFVVNNQAGKDYFIKGLGAAPARVFARPFLVPSLSALLHFPEQVQSTLSSELPSPIFLYVGQLIPRKGIKTLLQACALLKTRGYNQFSLLVIGAGEQRPELEAYAQAEGLENQIVWLGQQDYGALGSYFKFADIFVFPTNEDIWGMVLPEAMAFGKPVLCSQGAGAVELVQHGENGLVFQPQRPDELADAMQQFLDRPELISQMGEKSTEIMASHTPTEATRTFITAAQWVQGHTAIARGVE